MDVSTVFLITGTETASPIVDMFRRIKNGIAMHEK